MPRYQVGNNLTDKFIATVIADTQEQAIDEAYKAYGYKDHADALARLGTHAKRGELEAVEVDEHGFQTGPERLRLIRGFSFVGADYPVIGRRVRLCKTAQDVEHALGNKTVRRLSLEEAQEWVEPDPRGVRLYKSDGSLAPADTALTPADFALLETV